MNAKGVFGEECAAAYLIQQGYTVVERNFRTPYGEIDIIVQNDTYIVFVEVKARRSYTYGLPREAVNRRKQQRMTMAAGIYMSAHTINRQPRFDVIEIMTNAGFTRTLQLNHIQNAFDAGA